ncbi:glutathione binding-like protein [Rhizobium etli]|uniref:Glutathione S-transferase n=1 Tax=Rhizobium etli TaxID=29449 RepID=A0A7W6Y9L5_RHIET|nr:glutathione binding-like protein [Rhizobium etli]MBB4482771.1 glutathione S-transferase [Rhizobium etli]MBB4538453.1 glutathione S-transferase [Rhizobium etli]
MRLYFKPGACSLSSRIVLTELGLAYEAVKVDTEAGLTEAGVDYRTINPKGYVPALELESGEVITENPAILQYLAEQGLQARLAPAHGTVERAYLQQWLNFTSSELHKAYGPYFSGQALNRTEKDNVDAKLARRIGDVERALADGRSFILGESFTVADAYLFVVLNWSNFIGLDLTQWPHVSAFVARIASRPAVRSAMLCEGLVEEAVA